MQALFVAWQQPVTRRYFPVARLVSGVGEQHNLYEFAYIRGADEAASAGFQPFLAFPDLHFVYRSESLFPFFTNRLMSRKRPDFPAHLERLGLDASADDMTILSRSGGTRATDSIELFPLPSFDPVTNRLFILFWMHGFRYLSPEQQARVLQLQPEEPLELRPERDNLVDPSAVQIFTTDNVAVGWVPRYLASDATHQLRLADALPNFRSFVERVNQDPAPMQQRLLCRLESVGSANFIPCSTDVFRPLSANAVPLHGMTAPPSSPVSAA
jgi:hypothetical protein